MTKKTDSAKEVVLRKAKENRVRFVRLWFSDILGFLKSVAITVEELERALEDGMGFDGSSIEGFARIDESDMVAMPDPSTFRMLPWRPKEFAVAAMFCDVQKPGGEAFEGDPRFVLKRNLKKATDLGYTYYVGPEMEYFYFKKSDCAELVDQEGYFDMNPSDTSSNMRRDTIMALQDMGIHVEYSHHEVAPSQYEIDLRYGEALKMADNVMILRLVVKQIAQQFGYYATFMPKPMAVVNGSGMHVHQSLFKGKRNAFFDGKDQYNLSPVAKYFMAGLLKHSVEITLVTSQWVNSYKRLVPGYEAPVYVSWARRNRSDLVRIPEYKPGKEYATRLEYRSPDPACNPYLTFAVMLAAGLEGIEKKYTLPAPVEENVFEMGEQERKRRGIGTLPGSLSEAISCAEGSKLLKKALGDHVFNTFIQNKKIEWNLYRTQVTDYEVKRYLPIL